MKKLLLACVVLAACNSKKSEPKPEPAPTPKTAPEPAPAPAPGPTPTPQPAPAPPPAVVVVDKALPPIEEMPGLEFVGEPIEQDADFPKYKWVRTVLFDGKTPYIGFTYVDARKGNCIKGEEIEGLSKAEIKARLHEKFPSSSMEPIPAGHPITLLTPAEIKLYDLPAEPEWVSYYK